MTAAELIVSVLYPRAYWPRRIRRHASLAAGSIGSSLALFFFSGSPDPIWKASMATAYVGLALLGITLAIGPFNVLRARPNPVSTDLRRDWGIWAGAFGLLHTAVGLLVHLRGRPWLYFVWPSNQAHLLPLRYDAFGAANYTGLAADAILLVLLALSNDWSLRRFGTERWKSLQRWNYAGFGLVLVHTWIFQGIIEKRLVSLAFLSAACAVVIALQWAGCRSIRKARSQRRA